MPSNLKLPSEDVQRNLLTVVEHFCKEDRAVRERQIRRCRRLKLYWDNIFEAWFSEIAHDWRIWDTSISEDSSDQAHYDYTVNTFRAYIETIIAALSINTPQAKCYPEDAESSLDNITAKAGDRIGQLLARHNNNPLLWLKALYTFYTEGTVYAYGYPRADDKYGTYETPEYAEESREQNLMRCPTCGQAAEVDEVQDQFQAETQTPELCPSCGNEVMMQPDQQTVVTTKLVGKTLNPKSRVCLDIYGGLYVKIDNNAKTQEQTPYLMLAYETNYVNALEEYEHLQSNSKLKDKLQKGGSGPNDPYSQWGRLNTLYRGEYPQYVVTERKVWLRPAAFNILNDPEDIKELKRLYSRGVKVCMVNDEFGSAEPQELDDYWTISVNPMEDYLTHDPAGVGLVSTQEITNDIISLVVQTIEHGIGQTFADPGVLDFKAYSDQETTPGGIYAATPKSGKSLQDGFYQAKTATLSGEVMPFFEVVQGLAQLVSGALPSLFGGQLEGSGTASEYSMSRAQALQRVQNIWKLFTSWWKEVQGKAIPMFINNMKADEKDVQKQPNGSFINVFIRMSELHGKIGKVELEAADSLPLTWTQIKDTVMKAIETQNPLLLQMFAAPENIPVLRDAIGLTNFYIPGEDDRNKQNDEIQELLQSEPIQNPDFNPTDPTAGEFEPSVPIDVTYDNHQIQFDIVRCWVVSEAGRLAKIENEAGYQNVLLHGQLHYLEMQKQMIVQQSSANNASGKENPEKPKGTKEISGEEDVPVTQ